jgi:hypothetical protein
MMNTLRVSPGEIQVIKIDFPVIRKVREEILWGKRHGTWFPRSTKIFPGPAFFYSITLKRFIEVFVEKVVQGDRQLVCWREVVFKIMEE